MEKDIEYKSKTQIKKEVEALQKLGEELMDVPLPKLRRMDLPPDLMTALEDAKTITSNVARRRHRQYIGVLMRDVDPLPIRHALACTDEAGPVESPADLAVGEWMDRLLAGDNGAVEECLTRCPDLDRQRLRQLLRNINKEAGKKKPGKSRRTLSAILKAGLERP
ncbi:MAG: DUF615 domain-containing protein [Desulfobacterales bacterium]|nr:DUF615 domain-containing protein [Desulfobacterales bacterium]